MASGRGLRCRAAGCRADKSIAQSHLLSFRIARVRPSSVSGNIRPPMIWLTIEIDCRYCHRPSGSGLIHARPTQAEGNSIDGINGRAALDLRSHGVHDRDCTHGGVRSGRPGQAVDGSVGCSSENGQQGRVWAYACRCRLFCLDHVIVQTPHVRRMSQQRCAQRSCPRGASMPMVTGSRKPTIWAGLLFAALALPTSPEHTLHARPLSQECEVDQCMPPVEIVGSLVGNLDVTYAIDPNTVFGLPATIYYASSPVSDEIASVSAKAASAVSLQCADRAMGGNTVAHIREMGRTTSQHSIERQDDTASLIATMMQNAGTTGSTAFRGYTAPGVAISIIIVQWADGGTQWYNFRPQSSVRMERLYPEQLLGNPATSTPGDGVAREAKCGSSGTPS